MDPFQSKVMMPMMLSCGWCCSIFKTFGFFDDFGEEAEDVVRKGDDVVMQLEVSLTDLYIGKDIEVQPMWLVCGSSLLFRF